MSPSIRARLAFAVIVLVAAPRALADEAAAVASEPSFAVSSPATTTPAVQTGRPDWQLGIALPALFTADATFASAGFERRLADDVWLLFAVSGGVQHVDGWADVVSDAATVNDSLFGGGNVGVRCYLVHDGRLRPSLRASAGLGTGYLRTTVDGDEDRPQQTFWNANADTGLDVDVFLIDNVALRLGTSLLGARVQWGEQTIAGVTSATPLFAAASWQPQASAAVQVFF